MLSQMQSPRPMLQGKVGGSAGERMGSGVSSALGSLSYSLIREGPQASSHRGPSEVTLQAMVPPSLSCLLGRESWRPRGQLKAVLAKAVGRDLWATGIPIDWVSRCYLIKASLLDGPLSNQ